MKESNNKAYTQYDGIRHFVDVSYSSVFTSYLYVGSNIIFGSMNPSNAASESIKIEYFQLNPVYGANLMELKEFVSKDPRKACNIQTGKFE
jgi:hypothetical protein